MRTTEQCLCSAQAAKAHVFIDTPGGKTPGHIVVKANRYIVHPEEDGYIVLERLDS